MTTVATKKTPATGEVMPSERVPDGCWDRRMEQLPAAEVWGIAGWLAKRLEAMGIETVADQRAADPAAIPHRFSIVQTRTVLELRGAPSIPVEQGVASL